MRALRDDVVAVRAVSPRDSVALRVVTIPVRGVVVLAVVRAVMFWPDCDVPVWRFTLVASRTAALATPMPTPISPAKSKNFFIITFNMISKSPPPGNVYLNIWQDFFSKNSEKNPAYAGRNYLFAAA